MRKVKPLIFALILVLVFAGGAYASEQVELSGSLKADLVGDTEDGSLTDEEIVNLILEKKFGFDADVHLDLKFNSYNKDQAVVPVGDGELETKDLPQSVRETEVEINKAYVNYYTKNMDWRLGKQEMNWGSAYKLQPTDYFNPRDLTALKPLDEKVGVKAVKGTYYAPANVEITGIVTPFFATHKMRAPEKVRTVNSTEDKVAGEILNKSNKIDYGIEELNDTIEQLNSMQGTSYPTISLFDTSKDNIKSSWITQDIVPVADEFENIQGGMKATKRSFKGFDISISAYQGRDKMPAVNRKAIKEELGTYEELLATIEEKLNDGQDPSQEIDELNSLIKNAEENINLPLLIYPETNRVGFDVIGDIGDMGVWTETAYTFYEDDQFNNRLEAAVGADYKFENDLYLVGQVYYREGRLDNEDDLKALNVHFDKPVFDFHEIEMNVIYEFETETYLLEPQFNYSLANSTTLQLGGTYKESDNEESTDLISSLGDDRVYMRLKVDF